MTSPFEEGDPQAPICLVGEAPSYVEMREGRPFVGPAGQLLERLLHAAGIPRVNCYITNVFDEEVTKPRDDNNKIVSKDGTTLLWTSGKGFTPAGIEASAPCRERLARCTSNVIVPLGAPALSLTCGDSRPISKWRGSIIAGVGNRKLVPTFHPSACLRGVYEWRWYIVSDLKKARRESAHPEVKPVQRNFCINPSFDEARDYLIRCSTAPFVATDIELLGGSVDCFSLAPSATEAISIPIIDAGFEARWTPEEETEIWRLYAGIISNPAIRKINQNITFDLACLLQLNHIVPQGPVDDCMVAHSVMNPFLDKDLGTLCSLYTNEPFYKDQGELHDSFTVKDFERRWIYNAKDAAVALECWQALEPLLDKDGYRRTYEMTMRLVPSLVEMTVGGVRVNAKALKVAKEKAEAEIAALIVQMEPMFGRKIITEAPKTAAQKRAAKDALNINSPAQLMDYFYQHKGLKPYKGKTDRPTIDDKALVRIVRRDGLDEARLLQEYRRVSKSLSSYLGVKYDADDYLRSSWNIRGAWTGRLSCSKSIFGTGLNQQTMTEDFAVFVESEAC
ncbi:MAG: hypothetical protein KGL39_51275 [Patescibacteria group bacterium]|nr:hypothetical protein [Patescibacteria group bacterium]